MQHVQHDDDSRVDYGVDSDEKMKEEHCEEASPATACKGSSTEAGPEHVFPDQGSMCELSNKRKAKLVKVAKNKTRTWLLEKNDVSGGADAVAGAGGVVEEGVAGA